MAKQSSAQSGANQSQPQTSKQADSSEQDSVGLTKLSRLRVAEALVLFVMLGLLATALSACSTPSTQPSEWPRNPTMPPLSQSPPTETYSSSVSANIKRWESLLTSILPTP
jgi:hypothetical protein